MRGWMVFIGLTFFLSSGFWGCNSNPVVSTGCTELDLSRLEGTYQREQVQRGHNYSLKLSIELLGDSDCIFTYHIQTFLMPHEGQPNPLKVYESLGELWIVKAKSELGILIFTLESRKLYHWLLDERSKTIESTSPFVYDRTEAKLWDSVLSLWDNQYRKVD